MCKIYHNYIGKMIVISNSQPLYLHELSCKLTIKSKTFVPKPEINLPGFESLLT
ncbi:hypothetical protein HMPREF1981_02864 [Bacteroides pyogenes F0041]|uniref:Uncharacterized protein n=1 Tax=Bacteroides pyogenes F0041 TaxID=1321819 RepID=U2CCW5_9BACE|nr:hypothetical protein HMPREF1981_02864 [Bacteroides pyogenes F0041]